MALHIGEQIPDLEFAHPDGGPVHLSALIDRTTLLLFLRHLR